MRTPGTFLFENHSLRLYRTHLLGQLHHSIPRKRLAAQRLCTAIHPDDEMAATLRALTQDADPDLRHAATMALDRVREVRDRR